MSSQSELVVLDSSDENCCAFCPKESGCKDWKAHIENPTTHRRLCPHGKVGKPSFKGVSPTVGDFRDVMPEGSFTGAYPPRLNDKGERVAGYKNPPPPGQGKGET